MAQREGSVYLYLFIVASVLFLIMTVMFFVTNAAKEQETLVKESNERKFRKEEQKAKQLNDDIGTLKDLIAGPSAEQWQEIPQLKSYFLNDELKAKAEKAIGEALTDLGLPTKVYSYLVEPYGDLAPLLQRLRQVHDVSVAERAAASQREVEVKQNADQAVNTLRTERQTTLDQLRDLQARFEDLDNTGKAKEGELVEQLENVRQEMVAAVTSLRRQINFKDNEIRSLQAKLSQIQEQMRREEDIESIEPDGKIQYVLASSGKAWIDLGRRDHVQKGLQFRVFQTIKGGKRVFKGFVEIAKVDEDMSEVRIVTENDSLNPIVAGDFVASPFYDRQARPVFVFAGSQLESTDVTKQLVIAKMESYGAVVQTEVDQNTDFLVAMMDYENTPEYKTAKALEVKIIRERDLLAYLGY